MSHRELSVGPRTVDNHNPDQRENVQAPITYISSSWLQPFFGQYQLRVLSTKNQFFSAPRTTTNPDTVTRTVQLNPVVNHHLTTMNPLKWP